MSFNEGDWIKTESGMLVCLERMLPEEKCSMIGYGFNLEQKWREPGTKFGFYSSQNNRVATDEEVREALIREAKLRGYEEGNFTCLLEQNTQPFYDFDDWTFLNNGLYTASSGHGGYRVFFNGKWAKKIERKKEMPLYAKGTWLAIGCDRGCIVKLEEWKDSGVNGGMVGTGVDNKGDWRESISWGTHNVDRATPDEIKEALIKEAKKRGFGEGVRFITAWPRETNCLFAGFNYDSSRDCLHGTGSGNECIYQNGVWAKIVEKPKPKKKYTSEIKEALVKEAKERYSTGDVLKKIGANTGGRNGYVFEPVEFNYYPESDHLFCNSNHLIYAKGEWAEVEEYASSPDHKEGDWVYHVNTDRIHRLGEKTGEKFWSDSIMTHFTLLEPSWFRRATDKEIENYLIEEADRRGLLNPRTRLELPNGEKTEFTPTEASKIIFNRDEDSLCLHSKWYPIYLKGEFAEVYKEKPNPFDISKEEFSSLYESTSDHPTLMTDPVSDQKSEETLLLL